MRQFFEDSNGRLSSKRLFGMLCFTVATVGAFLHVESTVVISFLSAATAVFVGQALTKT